MAVMFIMARESTPVHLKSLLAPAELARVARFQAGGSRREHPCTKEIYARRAHPCTANMKQENRVHLTPSNPAVPPLATPDPSRPPRLKHQTH